MRDKRYVEIYPDKDNGFIIRFMLKGKGLMHVRYAQTIPHSLQFRDWIDKGEF
jgi:hypothetical protein